MTRFTLCLGMLACFLTAGSAVAADLYWCPVCGGNTHHYDGHPHFSRGSVTPPPPPLPPQPDPREIEARRLYQEVQGIVDDLNERRYDDAGELRLLQSARGKLERIIQLNPGHPYARDVQCQIDVGISDWNRRANNRERMEKLARAKVLNQATMAALSEQAAAGEAATLRKKIEGIRKEPARDANSRLTPIGAAGAVKGEVWAQASGGPKRLLKSGSVIYFHDTILTSPDGQLQMMLLDETVFTIGSDSEMLIDEFVYDPLTDSGKILAHAVIGVFRFVTGKIARKKPSEMNIKLPSGTIGPRGTDFLVSIEDDRSMDIAVFAGGVVFAPDDGGETSVKAGEVLAVSAEGMPGRLQRLEDLVRAASANLLIALVSLEGLGPVLALIKVTQLILGLAAMFGWVWSNNLRDGRSMVSGFVVGGLLLTGAYLVSHFFAG